MRRRIGHLVAAAVGVTAWALAIAGQAPSRSTDPDIAITHRDRVYAAEQFSNTVSVIDPADNGLLGVIRLGVTRRPPILAPSTGVKCWFTVWASRRTIERLPWCPSAPTRLRS